MRRNAVLPSCQVIELSDLLLPRSHSWVMAWPGGVSYTYNGRQVYVVGLLMPKRPAVKVWPVHA